jgi:hypothetical protein
MIEASPGHTGILLAMLHENLMHTYCQIKYRTLRVAIFNVPKQFASVYRRLLDVLLYNSKFCENVELRE